MQTALYTRISQDQTGEALGVTRQLADCTALADRLGWTVAAHYDDNDLSAYSGKERPRFEDMLAAMKAGEFGALICWHVDRLYRSMKDLERLIDIADTNRVQIRTVNSGDLDLSTSAGRMIARILGSVARQESEHKGERHRRANIQHAADGKWVAAGHRTFGYTRHGSPLQPEAGAVRKAVADVLTGVSLLSICRDWNEQGLTTSRGVKWTGPKLRAVLMRPVYAALRVHRGEVVGPGDWEPLIDPDTHYGLIALLSDESRTPAVAFERRHLGSGVYHCGRCGNTLYAAYTHGRNGKMQYLCKPHRHLSRLGAPLDEYVEAIVLEYLRRSDIHELLADRDDRPDVGSMQAKRTALQVRLDELSALFRDGVLDGPAVRRDSAILRKQIAGIDTELAEAARVSPAAALLAVGGKFEERWAAASVDIRSKIVDELITVTVMPGRRGPQEFDYDLIRIEWKGAHR